MSDEWGDYGIIVNPIGMGDGTLIALDDELIHARKKFPGNRHLLAACLEELGEVARALLQRQGADRVRKEALQVAVVALRIYEEGDASFSDVTDEEAKP